MQIRTGLLLPAYAGFFLRYIGAMRAFISSCRCRAYRLGVVVSRSSY